MFNLIAGWFVIGMFVAGAWITIGSLVPRGAARQGDAGRARRLPSRSPA